MKHHRVARVAAIIREVASETILFKISDPRVHLVTVTRVEVAADLQHAKVYVSIMGTPAQQRKAMVGLQHAAGFIQSQLGDRMRTRYTPVLRFVFDDGIKQSIEISRLISEALGRNAKDQPPMTLPWQKKSMLMTSRGMKKTTPRKNRTTTNLKRMGSKRKTRNRNDKMS